MSNARIAFMREMLARYKGENVSDKSGTWVCPRCGLGGGYAVGPCQSCTDELWEQADEVDEVAADRRMDSRRDERRT